MAIEQAMGTPRGREAGARERQRALTQARGAATAAVHTSPGSSRR